MTAWKRSNPWRGRWLAACCGLAAAAAAHAGGHFEVDDAGTLDAGQCQVELWGSDARRSNARLLHVGPSCGVGPVELGLNADAVRGGARADFLGPQLKWTFFGRAPHAPLSAALSASAQKEVTQGGRWGGQGLLAVSWQALDSLAFNANLGADWSPGSGARTARGGVQLQWNVLPELALVAERNRSFSQWGNRLGLSWQLAPKTSIDLSVARLGLGGGETVYTLGINQVFDLGRPAATTMRAYPSSNRHSETSE